MEIHGEHYPTRISIIKSGIHDDTWRPLSISYFHDLKHFHTYFHIL